MEEGRTMLAKLLRIIGFHVQEAVNGKQTIEIFDVMKKHLDLKYTYEETMDESGPVQSKVEIGPEQLAVLPNDLLSQLYQATLESNKEQREIHTR
jgi:hypothetical protein